MALPALLKTRGSFSDVALLSLALYPFSLKLLWSPVVDSVAIPSIGLRRTWIVSMQLAMGVVLFMLGLRLDADLAEEAIPTSDLTLILFTLVLATATQDIAVDGWALDLLPTQHRRYASATQSVGIAAGIFLSSTGLTLAASEHFGPTYLGTEGPLTTVGHYSRVCGCLFVLVAFGVLLVPEGQGSVATDASMSRVYRAIRTLVQLPSTACWW